MLSEKDFTVVKVQKEGLEQGVVFNCGHTEGRFLLPRRRKLQYLSAAQMCVEKESDPEVTSLSDREDVALSKSEVKRDSEEKVRSSVLARLGTI